MRYTPAAVALSLVAAVSSSVLHSQASEVLDPRASALMEQGQASLKAGATGQAVDAFEAALAVEPGSVAVLVALAEAERAKGLTGKAIRYYRIALERDPRNLAALAGEGVALAEKGATEKANRRLARLESLCGADCAQTRDVSAAIARGPSPENAAKVVSAPEVKTTPGTQSANQ